MDDNKGWKRFRSLSRSKKSLASGAKNIETSTVKHARRFVLGRLSSIKNVRRQVISWLMLVGALIVVVVAQFIWFQHSYRAEAVASGGTYAEGVLGPIDTLNPLYAKSPAEQSASQLIFSRLFDYDKTGHLRRDLAVSMTVDGSGKQYIVKLRDGVKWHDGENLTAKDVAFTVNTMKNPEARAVMRTSWTQVQAKALDDKTVQFDLPAPYAAFPQALTFAILPEHLLSSVSAGALRESPYSVSPVGSGPFKMKLLQSVEGRDKYKIVHLNAWKDYYKGEVKLSRFEIHAYDSQDAILRALESRDVNAALGVNDVRDKISKSSYDIQDYPIDSGVYALMNTSSEIVKDPVIRQALARGTDTDAIRQQVGLDHPSLELPFLQSQVSSRDLPKRAPFDQNEAKRLLDEAGWKQGSDGFRKNGDGKTLKVKLVALNENHYNKVIDTLARQWRDLGVEVDVEKFDAKALGQNFTQSVLQPRNYDVLVNELAIGADPDVFAYWHSSQATMTGLNFSNYRNGLADDALTSARLRNEPSLRAEKYSVFAAQWLKDVPAIGIYQSVATYTRSKQSTAMENNASLVSTNDRFTNIQYWTVEKGEVYKTP